MLDEFCTSWVPAPITNGHPNDNCFFTACHTKAHGPHFKFWPAGIVNAHIGEASHKFIALFRHLEAASRREHVPPSKSGSPGWRLSHFRRWPLKTTAIAQKIAFVHRASRDLYAGFPQTSLKTYSQAMPARHHWTCLSSPTAHKKSRARAQHHEDDAEVEIVVCPDYSGHQLLPTSQQPALNAAAVPKVLELAPRISLLAQLVHGYVKPIPVTSYIFDLR
ncbi:hypothetical protein K438DRAFT_1991151 [Mycena galopus ATCC 62051]|nr:hypothetical protein K438DRAFT_1991151 [Mycena galopus ATCC 62051]